MVVKAPKIMFAKSVLKISECLRKISNNSGHGTIVALKSDSGKPTLFLEVTFSRYTFHAKNSLIFNELIFVIKCLEYRMFLQKACLWS